MSESFREHDSAGHFVPQCAHGAAGVPGTGKKSAPFPPSLLQKAHGRDMVNRHRSPVQGESQAQESVMDYLFFFVGIIAVICALTYIKKTSPNRHH